MYCRPLGMVDALTPQPSVEENKHTYEHLCPRSRISERIRMHATTAPNGSGRYPSGNLGLLLRSRELDCEWSVRGEHHASSDRRRVMPILDVTPLGSSRSGTAGAVAAIVDYLTRSAQQANPTLEVDAPAAYYADRAERPGIWRGRGVIGEQLTGEATPEQLTRLLLGGHPTSGAVLVASTGSSGRAARDRTTPPSTITSALDVDQTATRLGVDRSYVKRLLLATERHTLDPDQHRQPLQPLHGHRNDAGRWRVDANEVERFISARTEPKVVVAYDATFKWEKSMSTAWVQADPATRRVIEEALDLGVRTGITYLENHGLQVRDHDRRVHSGFGLAALQAKL